MSNSSDSSNGLPTIVDGTPTTDASNGFYGQEWLELYLAGNVTALVCGALVSCQALHALIYSVRRSHPVFKWIIVASLAVYTVIITCLMGDTIETFGYHWGDDNFAASATTFYCILEAMGGLLAALVQTAYAFRAWRLVGSQKWLAPLLITLPFFTAGPWFYSGFGSLNGGDAQDHFAGNQLTYIAPVVADVVIMLMVLYGLWRVHEQSYGGTERTRRLLFRVAFTMVSCNALATAVCILQLIASYTGLATLYCLDPIIPSLYLFSLCLWLAMRQRIANAHNKINTPTSEPKFASDFGAVSPRLAQRLPSTQVSPRSPSLATASQAFVLPDFSMLMHTDVEKQSEVTFGDSILKS